MEEPLRDAHEERVRKMMLNPHQFTTYYHGTPTEENAAKITNEGLKATTPGEDEEWFAEWGPRYGNPRGVYLTTDVEQAKEYGDHVFSVDLPNIAFKDSPWSEAGIVYPHNIPKYLIRRVQ